MFKNVQDIKELEKLTVKFIRFVLLYSIPIFILFYYIIPRFVIKYIDFGFSHTENQLAPDLNAVVGPLFAFLGVLATLFAFYSQFKANLIQMDNFSKSLEQNSKQFNLNQFETKYFNLIRLHKENIGELEIENLKKRQCFILLCSEFKEIYNIVKEKYKKLEGTSLKDKDIHQIKADISYTILMFGIGDTTKELIKDILANRYAIAKTDTERFVEDVFSELNKKNEEIENYEKDKFRNLKFLNEKQFDDLHLTAYRPFKGHQYRLSHYYRHLFQIVKFVEEHHELDDETKKHYLGFLKAQLGVYELSLFFFNSLSSIGKGWREFKSKRTNQTIDLVTKYELIKNLPPKHFTGELKPKEFYDNIEYEWEGIIKN